MWVTLLMLTTSIPSFRLSLAFRCAYCNYFNSARKQKPVFHGDAVVHDPAPTTNQSQSARVEPSTPSSAESGPGTAACPVRATRVPALMFVFRNRSASVIFYSTSSSPWFWSECERVSISLSISFELRRTCWTSRCNTFFIRRRPSVVLRLDECYFILARNQAFDLLFSSTS